ncbi:putative potassium channel domain-containing protein [Rosa chinensis]|uniref:Putative potassium channel domain-containing protein n=1 Tax=Rosa chinensis TaxID=74649 RepID=A0A2P6QTD3_ROSCH|nr:two-pore potassium channel 5 [Rosa chinensis]XP_040374070.1 two-pore potassium channel 5 [Rosa chinensis]PRQ37399.1 putative potassium channel domain-containing protein [Rosa chinensis]
MMPEQKQPDAWEGERANLNSQISVLTAKVKSLENKLVIDNNAWAAQKVRSEGTYKAQIENLGAINLKLCGDIRKLEQRLVKGSSDAAQLYKKEKKLEKIEARQKREEESLGDRKRVLEHQLKAFERTTQAVRSFAFFGRDTPDTDLGFISSGWIIFMAFSHMMFGLVCFGFLGDRTYDTFVAAYYTSSVTVYTVGFGDVTPPLVYAWIIDLMSILAQFAPIIVSFWVRHVAQRLDRRYLSDIQTAQRRHLFRLFAAFSTIMVTIGLTMLGIYVFERDRPIVDPCRSCSCPCPCPSPSPSPSHSGISSTHDLGILQIIHLAMMIVTTVGYGDLAFSTISGRLFATFWIPICVPLFAAATSYLVEAIIHYSRKRPMIGIV